MKVKKCRGNSNNDFETRSIVSKVPSQILSVGMISPDWPSVSSLGSFLRAVRKRPRSWGLIQSLSGIPFGNTRNTILTHFWVQCSTCVFVVFGNSKNNLQRAQSPSLYVSHEEREGFIKNYTIARVPKIMGYFYLHT